MLRRVNEAYCYYHDVNITRGGPQNDWTFSCADGMSRMKYHLGIRFFLISQQFIQLLFAMHSIVHNCPLLKNIWLMFARWQVLYLKSYILCHKADLRACSYFHHFAERLENLWYLGLSQFNNNLINSSTNFSFSSLNWNIFVSVSY